MSPAKPSPAPQRLALKLFAATEPGAALELSPYIGLFHGFIQEGALEGLLIDVADYAHVVDGPGILLVGHDVDYGIDLVGGRVGLLTTRKRYSGPGFAELLRDTLRKALLAAHAIHGSPVELLRFRSDVVEIQVLDRLRAPNETGSYERLRAEVESVFAEVYGDVKIEVARGGADDARRPLCFQVKAQQDVPADKLLERLGGTAVASAPAGVPPEQAQSPWDISVEELKGLRDSGAEFVLLDVREPHEYEICNLEGQLVPLGSLPQRVGELDPKAHVVVHCRTGPRSAKAVELLRSAGFENAWNVNGGILAWIDRIDPSLTPY